MKPSNKKTHVTNHLIDETSPYLQQHATNPVKWYPWGPQAFKQARKENKPIFLSIGYSTCHWCHVMAHESFEDPQVAYLLNTHFINIKVDREERPDIDHIYMNVCNLITGGGGWPLTIIMTPDKHPFYAATYIPKNHRFGHIGLMELLPQIVELWKQKPQEILKKAQQNLNALQLLNTPAKGPDITPELIDQTYQHLLNNFDPQHGGFNPAPKFPTPHHILFLLRYGHLTNTSYAQKMVEITLENLRLGGIYDHIGYGFHRYSTDSKWLVPHFEKMLYDQALLVYVYTEAYQVTQNPLFKQTIEEILHYITTSMTDSQGGFFSAEDADSEGIEGKFYTWTYKELKEILTYEEFRLIQKFYNIQKKGNYNSDLSRTHECTNILHQTQTITEYAQFMKQNEKSISKSLKNVRKKLYTIRDKRIHPHKDTKILTDWNGLMIAALAKASRTLNKPAYTTIAEKAVDFIITTMQQKDTGIYHSYRNGKSRHSGYADDYVFFIWGLLDLYQTTFNPQYLKNAIDLNFYLLKHFWDFENHGLFFTSNIGEKLIVRDKQIYDGAYPSANSVQLHNLIQLARITSDLNLEEKASQLSTAFSRDLYRMPGGYSFMINTLLNIIYQTTEIVIVGDIAEKNTNHMINRIRSLYLPNASVILKDPYKTSKDLEKIAPYLSQYSMKNNIATAYVCHNQQCRQPVTDPKELQKLLLNRGG